MSCPRSTCPCRADSPVAAPRCAAWGSVCRPCHRRSKRSWPPPGRRRCSRPSARATAAAGSGGSSRAAARRTAPPTGSPRRPRAAGAGNPQVTVRGITLRHLEDLLLELRRRLIGHPGFAPRTRSQAVGPVLLKRVFDLVEVTAGDAGALAGQADVLEFLGQRERAESGFDKLVLQHQHLWPRKLIQLI
jgi:hypothetical protein